MPERLRGLLAGLAVLVVAGCGGGEPAVPPTPVPTTPATAPSSAPAASPTPTSAAPTSASPSPTPSPSPSSSPSGRATPASTEDGTFATDLSVSEDGALSYVPLRWYTGANAEARCVAEDVEPQGAWCVEYYAEKAGGRKAATLTEGTMVRLLNDDLKPVTASLPDLVQAIEDEVWPNFQVAVEGGQVVRITQVFTP